MKTGSCHKLQYKNDYIFVVLRKQKTKENKNKAVIYKKCASVA